MSQIDGTRLPIVDLTFNYAKMSGIFAQGCGYADGQADANCSPVNIDCQVCLESKLVLGDCCVIDVFGLQDTESPENNPGITLLTTGAVGSFACV